MTSDIRVHMTHIRSLKLCARGTRAWFIAHNIDYNQFILEGTPVDELEATGDAFALSACAIARAEAEGDTP